MNRRTFVVHSSLATAGALLVPGPVGRLFAADAPLRALRGGVGIFTGRRGGTIGTFAGPEAALVVDTQFPDTAKDCLVAIRSASERKLDAVLITHHHGDHTGGIGVFAPAASRVIAQKNVPDLQKAQAERRGDLEQQVYPGELFETAFTLDLSGEVVRGRHDGPAHTGGDAVWIFEKANVVHVGDLVFYRMMPYIDRPGGASIGGWIGVLERGLASLPADALYIYGHAAEGHDVVGPRSALAGMRDYLSGLLDYVRKGKAAGKTVDDLAKVDRIPGFPDVAPKFEGAIKMNVEAAWQELGA